MSTAEKRRYTVQEYLEFERASEFKHEYYQGEIFAMTGASRYHNLITGNLVASLSQTLHDRPYEVYPAKMRVKVDATGLYTYPDVTVVCAEPEFEVGVLDTLLNPKLLVEVLSETTEAYDRGKKFSHYRKIDSLEEYVLVSQEEYRVEVFTKQPNGPWLLSEGHGRESQVLLNSLGCPLSLHDVYHRVEIAEPKPDQQHD